MTLQLSALLIGIFFCVAVAEGNDGIWRQTGHDQEMMLAVAFSENEVEACRRFVPEHQMWCARGPEISLGVKTNLLYWLVATPNAGLELFWRRRWSLSVGGVYACWLYNRGSKYYYVGAISSELRYWLRGDGRFNGHYIGAGLHLGQYDMQFGRTGEQADFFGGGFSYGYAYPVSKFLNIEFGLAIGLIKRDYTVYENREHEFINTGAGQKWWLGPTQARISCVWHIGNKRRGRR